MVNWEDLDDITRFSTYTTNINDIPTRNNFLDIEAQDILNYALPDLDVNLMATSANDSFYKGDYAIKVYGSMIDGSKAEVTITDIPVYFDVLIDRPNLTRSELLDSIISTKGILNPNIIITEIKSDKLTYSKEQSRFYRVFFKSSADRANSIRALRKKYTFYSDDTKNYYLIAARVFKLELSNWVLIKDYTYKAGKENEIISHKFIVKYKNYIKQDDDTIAKLDFTYRSNTMLVVWDIETCNGDGSLLVPTPELDHTKVFMICMSFHWANDINSLYRLCITDKKTISPKWTTFHCNSEEHILETFVLVLRRFAPDIISGFNDSGYDWPFICVKMMKYKMLPMLFEELAPYRKTFELDKILKFGYKTGGIQIKIDNSYDIQCRSPFIDGIVCIDSSIVVKKQNNKMPSYSLKVTLNEFKLPTKVDLDIKSMFAYYENGTVDEMNEIAYYCMIDSISVQRILIYLRSISNYRDTSSIACISIQENYKNAIGLRVVNLLAMEANDKGKLLRHSMNISDDEGKFPGAYVFNPIKGLTPNSKAIGDIFNCKEDEFEEAHKNMHNERPVVAYDFASLYPSIMILYNLSPDTILISQEQVDEYPNKDDLHHIEFEYDSKLVHVWAIKHHKDPKKYGLIPEVLSKLASKRKYFKGLLKTADDKLRHSEGLTNEQIEILKYEKNYYNLKQNGIKVYMNSFYGEMGNKLSPFYLVELAGSVTKSGKQNILNVANYIEREGFKIKYGDTDSLYVTLPNKLFYECDKDYKSSKINIEEYYRKMVEISMNVMNTEEQKINSFIESQTNSKILRMECEGCYYPMIFLGKKKYFGLHHIEFADFNNAELSIKGLDVIKTNTAGIVKKISEMVMDRTMSIPSTHTILDIVKNVIKDAFTIIDWEFEDFILRAKWKPKKDNKSVKTFMDRMQIYHLKEIEYNKQLYQNGLDSIDLQYTPIKEGESFDYVIVEPRTYLNVNGTKLDIKAGNLMEYASVALKNKYKIWTKYYMEHYVVGACARFINSEDIFNPPKDCNIKEDYYRIDKSKKFLIDYIKKISPDVEPTKLERKIANDKYKTTQEMIASKQSNNVSTLFKGPLDVIMFKKETESVYEICEKIFRKLNVLCTKNVNSLKVSYYKKACEYMNINPSNGDDINPIKYKGKKQKPIIYLYKKMFNKMQTDMSKQYLPELENFIKSISESSLSYKEVLENIIETGNFNFGLDFFDQNGININHTFIELGKLCEKIMIAITIERRNEKIKSMILDILAKRNNDNMICTKKMAMEIMNIKPFTL